MRNVTNPRFNYPNPIWTVDRYFSFELFFALAIPLDDPVSTKQMSVALFFEAVYDLPMNAEKTGPASTGEDRSRIKRRTDRQ